jgi:hypothetical protein
LKKSVHNARVTTSTGVTLSDGLQTSATTHSFRKSRSMALPKVKELPAPAAKKNGPSAIVKKHNNNKKNKEEGIKPKQLVFSKKRASIPPKVLMVVKKNEK